MYNGVPHTAWILHQFISAARHDSSQLSYKPERNREFEICRIFPLHLFNVYLALLCPAESSAAYNKLSDAAVCRTVH